MLGNLRIHAGWAAAILSLPLIVLALGPSPAQESRLLPAGLLLASGETVVGERIVYPTQTAAKVTASVVTLAPGQETGWHTHGMPVMGYVLEGELAVDYGERGVRTYRTGDAFLEAIDVVHNGRNTGTGPMRILAVFMGAEGLQPSHPAQQAR